MLFRSVFSKYYTSIDLKKLFTMSNRKHHFDLKTLVQEITSVIRRLNLQLENYTQESEGDLEYKI